MESFAAFAKQRLGEHIQNLEVPIRKYFGSTFALDAYPYHEVSATSADIFKEYMFRPAKRLRASFVMEAFRMFAGDITPAIIDAAIAIEMVHAYLLLVDDFNDKSDLRRGDPTGHKMHIEFHHKKGLIGDDVHYGYSLATLTGMLGMHQGSNLLLSLDLPPEVLIRALRAVNQSVSITIYGQVRDIYNPQATSTTEHDVLEVHRLKTAYYTYFNPIQLGSILANQSDSTIAKFKEYTENAGIAFQIQDDILGVFGNSKDTGKSVMDDLKEGKATLLTVYAKEHATPAQKDVLTRAIGNTNLEQEPELFEQAKQVFIDTGSLDHSKQVAQELVQKAKKSMYKNFDEYKDTEGFKFIVGIADYMIERKL